MGLSCYGDFYAFLLFVLTDVLHCTFLPSNFLHS